MGKLVNKVELCEIIGKSQQTVTAWQQKDFPIFAKGHKGRENQYNTEVVIGWLIRRELSKLTITGDGELLDLEVERARLTHHQANKTSLEEDVLKGDLIPAEDVLEAWTRKVSAFRAKMLSIPTKTAHLLLNIHDFEEIEVILKSHVYEALQELSESDESVTENNTKCKQDSGTTAQLNS